MFILSWSYWYNHDSFGIQKPNNIWKVSAKSADFINHGHLIQWYKLPYIMLNEKYYFEICMWANFGILCHFQPVHDHGNLQYGNNVAQFEQYVRHRLNYGKLFRIHFFLWVFRCVELHVSRPRATFVVRFLSCCIFKLSESWWIVWV